jgi:hypothetical protein
MLVKKRISGGEKHKNPFIFVSQRGTPFTTAGFARLLERAAKKAKLEIKVHPHMLRHACGFQLANDGTDTRSLQATLDTRIFSTPCPIRNSHQRGSNIFGRVSRVLAASMEDVRSIGPWACPIAVSICEPCILWNDAAAGPILLYMIDSGIINLFDLLPTDRTSAVALKQRFLELSGKTARFLLTDPDHSLERQTPSVETLKWLPVRRLWKAQWSWWMPHHPSSDVWELPGWSLVAAL